MCHHIQCWRCWTRTLCKPWKQSMVSYVPSYIISSEVYFSSCMWAEAYSSLEERTKLLTVLLKEIHSLPHIYTRWRGKPFWLLVNSVEGMWWSCREQEPHADLSDSFTQARSVPGPAFACRSLPQLLTSWCLPMLHFPQPHRTDKTLGEAGKRVFIHFPSSYDAHLPLLPLLP